MRHDIPPPSPARPGEIHLKQWLYEQAQRLGVSPKVAHDRFTAGLLAPAVVRRVNKRVVLVTP